MQPSIFLEYQKTVWTATDAYMTDLTAQDYGSQGKAESPELTVAELLIMSTNQSLSHTGEIAALKGIQGTKVYPF